MSFTNETTSGGNRPAVVLLHSSASSARQWDRLAELLRPRFEVIAVDLHGHGAQPAWHGAGPLRLADEAALAESVLARTGGAHLVGHSYGAAVALKLATRYPASVHSVTAYEPVLFRLLFDDAVSRVPLLECFAAADAIRDHLVRGNPRSAAQRFVNYWSGGAGAWESMPAARQDAVASRMASVARHFDALFGESTHLPPATLPMLFLSGERTVASTRRIAELLRLRRPDARHETLPEMGHLGPITHAGMVNLRVASFLHEIESLRQRRDVAFRWQREDRIAA